MERLIPGIILHLGTCNSSSPTNQSPIRLPNRAAPVRLQSQRGELERGRGWHLQLPGIIPPTANHRPRYVYTTGVRFARDEANHKCIPEPSLYQIRYIGSVTPAPDRPVTHRDPTRKPATRSDGIERPRRRRRKPDPPPALGFSGAVRHRADVVFTDGDIDERAERAVIDASRRVGGGGATPAEELEAAGSQPAEEIPTAGDGVEGDVEGDGDRRPLAGGDALDALGGFSRDDAADGAGAGAGADCHRRGGARPLHHHLCKKDEQENDT